MKHIILIVSFILFRLFQATAQIIFPQPGPHTQSPANPNGPYAKPHTSPKPKPNPQHSKPEHINYTSHIIKPKPHIHPRPRPHQDYCYTHPIGYASGCTSSVWVSGRWVFIPEMHRKIWIEGYAVLTMPGGIYVSGHYVVTSRGMHWVPGHWINRGYPIYK